MKFNLQKFKRDIANEFAWHDITGITEEILTTIAENCIVSDVSLSAEKKIDNIAKKVEQLNTMMYSVKKIFLNLLYGKQILMKMVMIFTTVQTVILQIILL